MMRVPDRVYQLELEPSIHSLLKSISGLIFLLLYDILMKQRGNKKYLKKVVDKQNHI